MTPLFDASFTRSLGSFEAHFFYACIKDDQFSLNPADAYMSKEALVYTVNVVLYFGSKLIRILYSVISGESILRPLKTDHLSPSCWTSLQLGITLVPVVPPLNLSTEMINWFQGASEGLFNHGRTTGRFLNTANTGARGFPLSGTRAGRWSGTRCSTRQPRQDGTRFGGIPCHRCLVDAPKSGEPVEHSWASKYCWWTKSCTSW